MVETEKRINVLEDKTKIKYENKCFKTKSKSHHYLKCQEINNHTFTQFYINIFDILASLI